MTEMVAKKREEGGCKLCPKFTQTFMMLGKKWNGLIIEVLLEQPTLRFKALQALSPSAATGYCVNGSKNWKMSRSLYGILILVLAGSITH
jgi:Predicted transcriptional regulators